MPVLTALTCPESAPGGRRSGVEGRPMAEGSLLKDTGFEAQPFALPQRQFLCRTRKLTLQFAESIIVPYTIIDGRGEGAHSPLAAGGGWGRLGGEGPAKSGQPSF